MAIWFSCIVHSRKRDFRLISAPLGFRLSVTSLQGVIISFSRDGGDRKRPPLEFCPEVAKVRFMPSTPEPSTQPESENA